MSSRPKEFHLRALPEPCMTLSIAGGIAASFEDSGGERFLALLQLKHALSTVSPATSPELPGADPIP